MGKMRACIFDGSPNVMCVCVWCVCHMPKRCHSPLRAIPIPFSHMRVSYACLILLFIIFFFLNLYVTCDVVRHASLSVPLFLFFFKKNYPPPFFWRFVHCSSSSFFPCVNFSALYIPPRFTFFPRRFQVRYPVFFGGVPWSCCVTVPCDDISQHRTIHCTCVACFGHFLPRELAGAGTYCVFFFVVVVFETRVRFASSLSLLPNALSSRCLPFLLVS